MSTQAFMIQGNTVLIAANATSPAGVQIQADGNQAVNGVRLFNGDASNKVWVGFGASANEAKNNAIISVAGGSRSVGLPPLAIEIVRTRFATPNLYVSGITSVSVQANLEVTPGDGI